MSLLDIKNLRAMLTGKWNKSVDAIKNKNDIPRAYLELWLVHIVNVKMHRYLFDKFPCVLVCNKSYYAELINQLAHDINKIIDPEIGSVGEHQDFSEGQRSIFAAVRDWAWKNSVLETGRYPDNKFIFNLDDFFVKALDHYELLDLERLENERMLDDAPESENAEEAPSDNEIVAWLKGIDRARLQTANLSALGLFHCKGGRLSKAQFESGNQSVGSFKS